METRVAVLAIIVRDTASVPALNELLHQYAPYIIGRMGVRGEWYTSFDGRIVLYLAETDPYWMVPTAMDEQAAFDSELVEKTWGESYGGFEARLPLSALDADPSQYELCVAWRSNGHNALVHTGQMLEVE